jgi:uncharacterized protein
MRWSRFNRLFKSARHGNLLYNSLTNSFASLSEAACCEVERIKEHPDGYDAAANPDLYLQLLLMKALVDEQEEQELLNVIRFERTALSMEDSSLELTIIPTFLCNFDCTYCYQHAPDSGRMSEKVEKGILDFAKRFKRAKYLLVDWFGGEPLLCIDQICRITKSLMELGLPYRAGLTTNAYLLGPSVIERLEELRISSMQVTVDGPKEIHDARRRLKNGGGTFERIMGNLESLLTSWKGSLLIRVNIDKTNSHLYPATCKYLADRFPGYDLHIRPGIVLGSGSCHSECLNRTEDASFQMNTYRNHGITDFDFYPNRRAIHCAATMKNSYVIGPEGEIYKCWMDVGKKEFVVGSIWGDVPWNARIIAKYMVTADNFNEPECRECFFLPVCGGGCPKIRLESGFSLGTRDLCYTFKENLEECLEAHYEILQKRACASS